MSAPVQNAERRLIDALREGRLTGVCGRCGMTPIITLSPVNDTICIRVAPVCMCGAASTFNLWPSAAP